ncbi:ribonuclease HI family protein [Undibacterium baiyunense]|nr:ribonuclease HI family protein [Undibacterium baiyunense]
MPIDFETLQRLAFRRELVESRRLARNQGTDFHLALEQVLTRVAAGSGLSVLLQQRQQDIAKQAEIKLQKKRVAETKYAIKQARNMVSDHSWCGWFDGSAQPNPGDCYIGVVLKAPSGQVWEISCSIGYGDSSYAEYRALLALLELAVQHAADSLIVYGDSQVVITDLQSAKTKQIPTLLELRSQVENLMKQIPAVQLKWISRAKNLRADELARLASIDRTQH